MIPDLQAILISTDSKTGDPSVFDDLDDARQMYAELGWDGDPAGDGIIPIADHIADQRRLGLDWDADDWAESLRKCGGTALDDATDDELLAAIEDELDDGLTVEADASPTLELCTNVEAMLDWCGLDFSPVAESDRYAAAIDFYSALDVALTDAGYKTEHAKGQRSMCHGWNGANTFRWKSGPVGTFAELTNKQRAEIIDAIATAEQETVKEWSSRKAEFADDADDYLICALCGAETPSTDAAIEAGWVPSYWDGDAETDRPVCAACVAKRLRIVDGEWELVR